MNTVAENLKRLEQFLIAHDWYYEFSDDYSVWTRGRDQAKDIAHLAKLCKDAGAVAEVAALFEKYSRRS